MPASEGTPSAGYSCEYPNEMYFDPQMNLAPGPFSLSGTVLRADGSPANQVVVSVGSNTTVTDPAGQYRLEGLPTGVMIVAVDPPTEDGRRTGALGLFRAPVWGDGTFQELLLEDQPTY